MLKNERWKVSPPAPLTEKSRLLADVRDWAATNDAKIVRLWVALDPSLLLIEQMMVEYEPGLVAEQGGTL